MTSVQNSEAVRRLLDSLQSDLKNISLETKRKHPSVKESAEEAIVKIRKKAGGAGVRFSDSVAPVCLPGQGTRVQDGTSCVISGWGKLLRE